MPTLVDDDKSNVASDERFRKLVEGAPDGIVISREGVVLYANPAAVRLLGYDTATDLVGRSMQVFLDPSALATMRRRIQGMQATGETPIPREYPAKRRDGSQVTAEISSILIEYEGAPAVLAFARDVTEQVRLRAELAHFDRLAALGRMAAGVAHEINNPLAFVILAVDLLERHRMITADDNVQKLVANMRSGVSRIAAIVRDLRTYGQYEDEPVSAVDLGPVIDSAERVVAHELRPRVRLRKAYQLLPPVLGIAMRLEQVFVNFLLNAAFAISDGRDDGEIVIRATVGEHDVVVEVADNGEGMSDELLRRIFEPFFTTKPAISGTGLGLSICRDIVLRLGGDIIAESELGRGTTMRLVLPRAMGDEPSRRSVPAEPSVAPRRRVLVIDDEPLIVDMVVQALSVRHDVVGVSDGPSGLALILGAAKFDVILCDLMMPGMSGMEVYARVAEARPGLEQGIVFVTGGVYTPRAAAFLDEVPNARLVKPLSAEELEAVLVDTSPSS